MGLQEQEPGSLCPDQFFSPLALVEGDVSRREGRTGWVSIYALKQRAFIDRSTIQWVTMPWDRSPAMTVCDFHDPKGRGLA